MRLTTFAEDDIVDILAWSRAQFGEAAARRYESLITSAMADLIADPFRPGSADRPELGPGARSWHLRTSRRRVGRGDRGVGRPRHLLIYRIETDVVVVGRVLHDAMELTRHLPDDWD
ncbi:MAG TPA: type II toxin-antitoxin system RelE/ParE family toxin [Caulobacteraceae bacterium]